MSVLNWLLGRSPPCPHPLFVYVTQNAAKKYEMCQVFPDLTILARSGADRASVVIADAIIFEIENGFQGDGDAMRARFAADGLDEFARANLGKRVSVTNIMMVTAPESLPTSVTHTMTGHICMPEYPAAGKGGLFNGYDAIVVPNGYEHSIAYYASERVLISPRVHNALAVRAIFSPKCDGVYELHVTVAGAKDEDRAHVGAKFRADCGAIGVGSLFINQGRPDEELQTKQYVVGTDAEAAERMHATATALRARGWTPVLGRVEAMAYNPGTPKTDDEARAAPSDRYFEFHMKVETDNVDQVRALVRGAKVELSTVGNKVSVTRKFYGIGLTTALESWAVDVWPLVRLAKNGEINIKQIPLEYCIATVHF